MNTPWTRSCSVFLTAAVLLAVSLGCRKEEPAPKVTGEPTIPDAKNVAKIGAADEVAVKAVLAKADLVDGKEDHIVSKCGACSLGMDGSAEHALKAAGYKMHFCSEGCRDGFAKDASKAILAMNVPGD